MHAVQHALALPPERVRNGVRNTLTAAREFQSLDPDQQRTIAHSLVRIAHAAQLLEKEANANVPSPPKASAMSAGDEFSGTAVNRLADTTRAVLGAISFPRFVKELISGVFKAMVETNQQQLQQYVELTRAVSQSIEGFQSLGGDDDAARAWLAERFPQSYRLELPDPEDREADSDEEPEPARLITLGSSPEPEALRAALGIEADAEVPSGGPEVLVPFVRRSLARNKQQMLATMVQMGMQRIVIDSGRIHAAMRFHIDASSAAEEARRSQFDTRTTIGARASGGFGLWSASASVDTTIGYVEANDRQSREQLNASADLNSSVEIHFRTDQVPLDRIASSQTVNRLRLNTLNPEQEMRIAQQTDAARINAAKEVDVARFNRPPLQPAAAAPAPVDPSRAGSGASQAGSPSGNTAPGSGGNTAGTPSGTATGREGTATGSSGNNPSAAGGTGSAGSPGSGGAAPGNTPASPPATGGTSAGSSTSTGSPAAGSTGTAGSTGGGSAGSGSTATPGLGGGAPAAGGTGAGNAAGADGARAPPPAQRRG